MPARRLVYYDQRGSGGSTKPPDGDFGVSAQLRDLEAVRRWTRAETIDLVGQSWGGLLAAAYTARHPDRVRSLVLLDAAPLDWPAVMAGEQRFAERRAQMQRQGAVPSPLPPDRGDSCLPSLTALLPVYAGDPSGAPPIFHTSCTASTSQAGFAAVQTEAGRAELAALASRLATYTGRALLIMGSRDPFGLEWLQRQAELLAAAQVEQLVVPGAGHLSWIERPQVVLPALARWLAGPQAR